MSFYINIHTHHLNSSNCISIYNHRFLYEELIHTDVFFSTGIHPYDYNLITENSFTEFEVLITNPNCKAIGECGLDKLVPIDINIQVSFLQKQLNLASKYNKPVIVHCVKAFNELIKVCKPYHSRIPILIHGFNNSDKQALQLINEGFYVSLNQKIESKLNFDFQSIPISKLFLETDDNPNFQIQDVYKFIASKYNLREIELKEKIYDNFAKLFL